MNDSSLSYFFFKCRLGILFLIDDSNAIELCPHMGIICCYCTVPYIRDHQRERDAGVSRLLLLPVTCCGSTKFCVAPISSTKSAIHKVGRICWSIGCFC